MSLVTRYGAGAPAPAATDELEPAEIDRTGGVPERYAPGREGHEHECTREHEGPCPEVDAAPAPFVVESELEADEVAAQRARVRSMFGGLGWSTSTAPTIPAPAAGSGLERDDCGRLEESAELARDRVAVVTELVGPPAAAGELADPYNAVTGARYRGKNVGRLLEVELERGYGSGGWAGFQQWITAGRVVRKGEHGTSCITVIGGSKDDAPAPVDAPAGSSTTARKGRGVRGFRVFHFDQTTELAGSSEGGE